MTNTSSAFFSLLLCCCILIVILFLAGIFLFISYGSEFVQLVSTLVFIRDIVKVFFPKRFNKNKSKDNKNLNNITKRKSLIEDAEFREVKN